MDAHMRTRAKAQACGRARSDPRGVAGFRRVDARVWTLARGSGVWTITCGPARGAQACGRARVDPSRGTQACGRAHVDPREGLRHVDAHVWTLAGRAAVGAIHHDLVGRPLSRVGTPPKFTRERGNSNLSSHRKVLAAVRASPADLWWVGLSTPRAASPGVHASSPHQARTRRAPSVTGWNARCG